MSAAGGSPGPLLLGELRGLEAEMVGLLRRLVEAESPSAELGLQATPQQILQAEFEAIGYGVRLYPGRRSGGLLLVRPRHRSRRAPVQLIIGHSDTVWPVGTLERMPLHLRDGRLYGPGAYDMKGGLVEIVFALRALRALELEPQVVPIVLVSSDEEIGSPDSWGAVRRLARIAERALVIEPSLGPDGKLKTARRGTGSFEIRVEGRAAHAGLEPEKGASAILELARVVRRLHELNDPRRGIAVNVGTIEGGVATNIIAPESRATVDVRVADADDARRVEKEILSLRAETEGTRLHVRGGMRRPPMARTPGNGFLFELAREAAGQIGLDLGEGASGGGSDGNITSLYAPTLDGLGPVGDGAHAAHEHVVLASLPERSALLALLLLAPSLAVPSAARIDA